MRIGVISDFYTDDIKPLTLLIKLEGTEDWTQPLFVYPIQPFEQIEPFDLGDVIGASVLLEDLIINRNAPGQFGIDLPQIASQFGYNEIEQLYIQLSDVEDILCISTM